jgi:propionyl-CoA synthetase
MSERIVAEEIARRWRHACQPCGSRTTGSSRPASPTSDAGFKDDDGYIYVMSRTDDIINVAGHRLSTGAMEKVLSGHNDIAECAVIDIADVLRGEIPCGLYRARGRRGRPVAEIEQECIGLIREKIGPVAAFKLAIGHSATERRARARSCAAP